MPLLLRLVVYMAFVMWVTLLLASAIRWRSWTRQGLILALGNRRDASRPMALEERAARTAQNTLRNFVLFTALSLVVQAAGATSDHVILGAEIFFWSRLVYIPVYLVGIANFRTPATAAGIVGVCLMVEGMFR